MRVCIRSATPADADTIYRFVVELAVYEREPEAVRCSAADLRAQLIQGAYECLIAERDGAAVGFALFFHNFSTWRGRRGLYLEDLFVQPAHRGLGIGKQLLIALARIARERDCARMEWSVLDWNQPAIDFYRALGAEARDQWTTYRLSGAALDALAARAVEANDDH